MRPNHHQEIILSSLKEFRNRLSRDFNLLNCTVLDLDLTHEEVFWHQIALKNTSFLGCQLPVKDELILRSRGAFIYNRPEGLPYNPFRKDLYTWKELMAGWETGLAESVDLRIYNHFSESQSHPPILEALSQRIHDHAIDNGLRRLLGVPKNGLTPKKCVGIMGGHGTSRKDKWYINTAFTAKLLSQYGYFIVSGGGPGIMEAANLGAWFGKRSVKELQDALNILGKAPVYTDPGYFESALKVLNKYPEGNESLAIPTWFYGHEPSNLFATYIAKYFSNSIREDTLLAISIHGIVYAPGSAGTTQEIFQEATQNHYGTFQYYSPMVFLGKERYEIQTHIYPLLKQLSWGKEYHNLLFITDHPEKVVEFLQQNPPVKRKDD